MRGGAERDEIMSDDGGRNVGAGVRATMSVFGCLRHVYRLSYRLYSLSNHASVLLPLK